MPQIFCIKLQQELEGFEQPPFPGPLGQRIAEQVSLKAWNMWLNHQTMLVNEYRLSLIDPKAREFLRNEMEKFLFGEGSAAPEGFVPEQ
ncbi:MAG: oxidative damage protection protein [Legionellaceae bacterium]|nr:oxidative damage protection protein [Legionellaceae bacterium]